MGSGDSDVDMAFGGGRHAGRNDGRPTVATATPLARSRSCGAHRKAAGTARRWRNDRREQAPVPCPSHGRGNSADGDSTYPGGNRKLQLLIRGEQHPTDPDRQSLSRPRLKCRSAGRPREIARFPPASRCRGESRKVGQRCPKLPSIHGSDRNRGPCRSSSLRKGERP